MSKQKRPEAVTAIQSGIGDRIRWAREIVYGPNSQAECADLIGVKPPTLNKIEAGTRAPSVFNIIALAARFRCSTDYLLRGLLVHRMDEELAVTLAALHPELAPQRRHRDGGKDTDPPGDKPQPPTRPSLSS